MLPTSLSAVYEITIGGSKTEIVFEVVDADSAVRSMFRQRIQGVEQIEPILQFLQSFKIRRRHENRDDVATFPNRDPLASEPNSVRHRVEIVGDFRDGHEVFRHEIPH